MVSRCATETRARQGFVLAAGEVGTGRSTPLRPALLEGIPIETERETALIPNDTDLSWHDLLELIAAEFGLWFGAGSNADCRIAIYRDPLERLADPSLRKLLRQRLAIEHPVRALRPPQIEPCLRHRGEVFAGQYEAILEPSLAP